MSRKILGIARGALAPFFVMALVGALFMVGCGGGGSQSGASTSSTSGEAAAGEPGAWQAIGAADAGAGEFSDVACPESGDCWATADIDQGGDNAGQIFHYEGSEWERVPTPGKALTLYGIACPASSSCWAVGAAASGDEAISTLIEHFDGKRWSVEESPNAEGFPESGLSGIACPSATECWAAGDGEDFSAEPTSGELLLLHYTGGTWSRVSAPSPQEEEQTGDGAAFGLRLGEPVHPFDQLRL